MSKNLFGMINTSPWSFMDHMLTWCSKRKLKMAIAADGSPFSDDTALFVMPSIAMLQSYAPALQGKRGVIVIFDSPLALAEIKGIRYLDCEKPTLSYMFQFSPMKLGLMKKVLGGEKLPKIDLQSRKIDLIPKLIERVRHGRFLDKFNNLVYNTSNLQTRQAVEYSILKCLFGVESVDTLKKVLLQKYKRSPVGTEKVKTMITFLEGKEGISFIKAVSEVGAYQTKKKPINYKKVSKTYGADKFELKFLARRWKKVQLDSTFKPIDLSEHVIKHKTKKPVD